MTQRGTQQLGTTSGYRQKEPKAKLSVAKEPGQSIQEKQKLSDNSSTPARHHPNHGPIPTPVNTGLVESLDLHPWGAVISHPNTIRVMSQKAPCETSPPHSTSEDDMGSLEMQLHLADKNNKMLMKETEEELSKWRGMQAGRTQHSENVSCPKLIYRLNTISVKIWSRYLYT